MFEKHSYIRHIVSQFGEPKFHSGAGYFWNKHEIIAHCVAADRTSVDNYKCTAAACPTKSISEHSLSTSEYVKDRDLKTCGSKLKHQTYPVTNIWEILRMPLSLFDMAERISNIPSPRKRFFQLIVAVTRLSPNTVKMILCSTTTGIYPKQDIRNRISATLGKEVGVLFPKNRTQAGSLIDIYLNLSPKKLEFHRFIDMLSECTGSSEKTIRKWFKARRIPGDLPMRKIAKAIGVSIAQLFPPPDGIYKRTYD